MKLLSEPDPALSMMDGFATIPEFHSPKLQTAFQSACGIYLVYQICIYFFVIY